MIRTSELPWLRFALQAHKDLAPDRVQTGHAPWQTIKDYGRHYGLKGQRLDGFIDTMRKMENAEADGHRARQLAMGDQR